MIMTHITGATLWVVYGILKYDYIVVGFNTLTVILISIITAYKVRELATTKATTMIENQETTSDEENLPRHASLDTLFDALDLDE